MKRTYPTRTTRNSDDSSESSDQTDVESVETLESALDSSTDSSEDEITSSSPSAKFRKLNPKTNPINDETERLFVANVHLDTSEETLQDFLGVERVQLEEKNNHKKFGYVFVTPSQKSTVLEMNGSTLDGAVLRIGESKDRGEVAPSNTLIVRNLSYETTSKDLMEAFSGAVIARIAGEKSGEKFHRGFAFIDFNTIGHAIAAKESMEKKKLNGRMIYIVYAEPPKRKFKVTFPEYDHLNNNTMSKLLTVHNLSPETTNQEVIDFFKGCTNSYIFSKKGGPKATKYARIHYDSIIASKKAWTDLHGRKLCRHTLHISYAKTKEQTSKEDPNEETADDSSCREKKFTRLLDSEDAAMSSTTLVVKNLPYQTSGPTLKKAFANAIDARIQTDKMTGKSKGVGFVEFPNVEEAMAAQEKMNGQRIDGRMCSVFFAEDRKKKTEEHKDKPRGFQKIDTTQRGKFIPVPGSSSSSRDPGHLKNTQGFGRGNVGLHQRLDFLI